MGNEIFDFCFQMKKNNISDYNDLHYTGGYEYTFNPFHKFLKNINS